MMQGDVMLLRRLLTRLLRYRFAVSRGFHPKGSQIVKKA